MRGKPKRRSGSRTATTPRPAARKAGASKRAAKAAGAERRKVPPFGRRSHRVTHAQARRMRAKFLRRYRNAKHPLQAGVYDRGIFDKILEQDGCRGIRFYPALDDAGELTLLFAGVDAEGHDMLAGIIGDMPWRCPPYCSGTNGILAH